jgi:hypothetical protein
MSSVQNPSVNPQDKDSVLEYAKKLVEIREISCDKLGYRTRLCCKKVNSWSDFGKILFHV